MRFDASEWVEVPQNEWNETPNGKIEIRSNRITTLFVRCLGIEAIASTGYHHRVTVRAGSEFYLECEGKQVKAYAYMPELPALAPEGEKYTNVERKPEESGTVLEVRRAVRELQVQAMLRRQAEAEAEAERAAKERDERAEKKAKDDELANKPAGQPEPEPEPEAEPEPEPEAD